MALTKHDLKSLEFAVNGLLMKIIFRSNNSEIIAECRYFQFNLPREEQKKKTKFEEKYNRCDACYLRVSWLGSGLFSVFLLYLFYHYCCHYMWWIKHIKINAYTLFRLGDCIKKFHNEHGRTQCSDYVTDGRIRIRFVLDTIYDDNLARISWRQYRLSRFCLQLQHGTGVHQQQHQSFHLRCQVPRVPARRQASDIETETESTQ